MSSFYGRRLGGASDPLEDCYGQCYYDAGLPLPFYFAVEDGVCYCCETWYVGRQGVSTMMMPRSTTNSFT